MSVTAPPARQVARLVEQYKAAQASAAEEAEEAGAPAAKEDLGDVASALGAMPPEQQARPHQRT